MFHVAQFVYGIYYIHVPVAVKIPIYKQNNCSFVFDFINKHLQDVPSITTTFISYSRKWIFEITLKIVLCKHKWIKHNYRSDRNISVGSSGEVQERCVYAPLSSFPLGLIPRLISENLWTMLIIFCRGEKSVQDFTVHCSRNSITYNLPYYSWKLSWYQYNPLSKFLTTHLMSYNSPTTGWITGSNPPYIPLMH